MNDWIDYYDSTHTIYANKTHRDVHFRIVAADIIRYIPAPDATVLDYACGEALSAPDVAASCGRLILAEPAPGVRGRVAARFKSEPKIAVHSLDELKTLPPQSVDLTVMNSVTQYMASEDLDAAFATVRTLLRPDGRLVVGDVLQVESSTVSDVTALLKLAAQHKFLTAALISLVKTALSDYRALREKVGLQRYSETEILARLKRAGFTARREAINIGHNQSRMTFVAVPIR
jgi:ubiquinone/menaquinone biosynthesis C-methylase UbiE